MKIQRARLLNDDKMTKVQMVIAALLSHGHNYFDISERLTAEGMRMSMYNVRYHANGAAAKIPGDLPTQLKIVAWFRGAPEYVLTGQLIRDNLKEGLSQ